MTERARPRKKRRRPATDAPKIEAPRPSSTEPPTATPRTGLLMAALAGTAYVTSVLQGGSGRDVLRAAAGAFAFLAGAIGVGEPRRVTVVFACIGAVGLCLVGIGPGTSGVTTTLDVGVGLAVAGVLGLGGSIHRLGRLGPA